MNNANSTRRLDDYADGEIFKPGEVWRSPRGTLYRVGRCRINGQAELQRMGRCRGRTIRRAWDGVMGGWVREESAPEASSTESAR
ncbi:MAG: hypothetical protein RJQ08_11730 [Salinisphaeraceae bacterium]